MRVYSNPGQRTTLQDVAHCAKVVQVKGPGLGRPWKQRSMGVACHRSGPNDPKMTLNALKIGKQRS